MKKLVMIAFAAAMSFGLTGCIDELFGTDDCTYFGNTGGCDYDFPYSCSQASKCYTSSSACSNGGQC